MRHSMIGVGVVAIGTAMVGSASGQAAEREAGPEWTHVPGSSVALELGGELLWRFNFDASLTHNRFHPLALPGVPALTVDAPSDHLHHHGLWLSWKYINGVNFWEHAPGTGAPAGRTSWTDPDIDLAEDGSASLVFEVTYTMPDGTVALRESRSIGVSAPGADGSYAIDWASEFEAVASRVVLDRTPSPDEPNGRINGGYAGFAVRMVQMDDRRAVSTQGEAEFNEHNRFRTRSNAFEYSGEIDGHEVGVAILVHPESFNTPSPWYALRNGTMTFFNAAAICFGPHEMASGETFELRYRVVVHPGRWTRDELETALGEFIGDSAAGNAQTRQTEERDDG